MTVIQFCFYHYYYTCLNERKKQIFIKYRKEKKIDYTASSASSNKYASGAGEGVRAHKYPSSSRTFQSVPEVLVCQLPVVHPSTSLFNVKNKKKNTTTRPLLPSVRVVYAHTYTSIIRLTFFGSYPK